MELYNSCICDYLPNHKKSPVSVSGAVPSVAAESWSAKL